MESRLDAPDQPTRIEQVPMIGNIDKELESIIRSHRDREKAGIARIDQDRQAARTYCGSVVKPAPRQAQVTFQNAGVEIQPTLEEADDADLRYRLETGDPPDGTGFGYELRVQVGQDGIQTTCHKPERLSDRSIKWLGSRFPAPRIIQEVGADTILQHINESYKLFDGLS